MLKERGTTTRSPSRTSKPTLAPDATLVERALAALHQAAQVQLDEQTILIEERNVWHPNSWLIQRCWETLADGGAVSEALTVARLLESRQPLAPLQALYRTAPQIRQTPALGPLLSYELERWQQRLSHASTDATQVVDQLLYVAAAAALLGEETVALRCLERIDQVPKAWARVVAHPEQRAQLATAIVYTEPDVLTTLLLTGAIRRFDDAGAQLLFTITTQLQQLIAEQQATPTQVRLMTQCVDTVRHAAIVNLPSRRIAAVILGQAGEVDEVVSQITTIQTVLAAQRATGYNSSKDDANLLRQVKRTKANRDIDFLVYTLCNAIEAMPLRTLKREQRVALADQVVQWGGLSDGWTAASAAATLIDLGAIKYAVSVVEQIPPNDPARSEGMLTLVRGLLRMNEPQLAAEEAERALTWARSQPGRNPERALTWGLADIYLQHNQPQIALRLLDRWREPTGWQHKVRTFLQEQVDDDTLRNSSLRFKALLQAHYQGNQATGTQSGAQSGATARAKEIRALFARLQKWAPRLLEGEALIHFYVDSLLQPLLAANLPAQVWEILPQVGEALATTSGNKHALRVTEVATLFAQQWQAAAAPALQPAAADQATAPSVGARTDLQPPIEAFLTRLWANSAQRGTWQTVHTIEGVLPLLLALEGPAALITIAQRVAGTAPVK